MEVSLRYCCSDRTWIPSFIPPQYCDRKKQGCTETEMTVPLIFLRKSCFVIYTGQKSRGYTRVHYQKKRCTCVCKSVLLVMWYTVGVYPCPFCLIVHHCPLCVVVQFLLSVSRLILKVSVYLPFSLLPHRGLLSILSHSDRLSSLFEVYK